MNKKIKTRRRWSEKEICFLKENYLKMGPEWCGDKLNRTTASILCKTNEIKIFRNINQNFINSESFIKMDTAEAVYIAGFLWADGHIRKNRRTVYLKILEEDMNEILWIFKSFGEWATSKIYPKNGKPCISITTHNKEICNFLINMDYKEKSYIDPIKILNYIPTELHPIWYRGFSDGDGSFYTWKRKKGFVITGRIEYPWEEMTKLFINLNIKYGFYKSSSKRGNSSRLHIQNYKGIMSFGNYIYDNYLIDKIGLYRKFKKFKEIKNNHKPKIKNNNEGSLPHSSVQ